MSGNDSNNQEEIAERIKRGAIDEAVRKTLHELQTHNRRVRFFTTIHDDEPEWGDLKDEYPQNAHRYRNLFEELGLIRMIENDSGNENCCLTPLGEAVWEGFIQIAAQSRAVHNLSDFFYATDWHSEIRDNWEIFKGSEVLVDGQRIKRVEGTYEGFVQALTEFKELTQVLTVSRAFDDRVSAGMNSEIVYPPQLVQNIRSDDIYLEMARAHEQADTEYYESTDLPPYQLTLMEIDADKLDTDNHAYQVLNSLSDNDNVATRFVSIWAWIDESKNVLLVNNDDEVLKWAEDIFEETRDAADRVKFRQGP